jgi:hypothetical protein
MAESRAFTPVRCGPRRSAALSATPGRACARSELAPIAPSAASSAAGVAAAGPRRPGRCVAVRLGGPGTPRLPRWPRPPAGANPTADKRGRGAHVRSREDKRGQERTREEGAHVSLREDKRGQERTREDKRGQERKARTSDQSQGARKRWAPRGKLLTRSAAAPAHRAQRAARAAAPAGPCGRGRWTARRAGGTPGGSAGVGAGVQARLGLEDGDGRGVGSSWPPDRQQPWAACWPNPSAQVPRRRLLGPAGKSCGALPCRTSRPKTAAPAKEGRCAGPRAGDMRAW